MEVKVTSRLRLLAAYKLNTAQSEKGHALDFSKRLEGKEEEGQCNERLVSGWIEYGHNM